MTEPGLSTFEDVSERFCDLTVRIEEEVRKRILGQDQAVRDVIVALVAGGHVLLEGVPGLGKTELLKALAETVGGAFSRIQFTPDLMPADVVGTDVITVGHDGSRTLEFREGPVFANLLLADEINRATPKSQSALLEAMQERQVTVGGATRPLPSPFMVLATQNPIELEGTYPLPEAQLDRFMLKSVVPTPDAELLALILDRTTGQLAPELEAVCRPADLLWLNEATRHVPIARPLMEYVALLVASSHPAAEHAPALVARYVRLGSSPRGGQAIVLAAKARALMAGRPHVGFADIVESAGGALRHRLLLNYEAAAEGVAADELVNALISGTPEPDQIKSRRRA